MTEIPLSEYGQDKNKNNSQQSNITDKSIIYAPFNTTLKSEDQLTLNHVDIVDKSSVILYRTKVRDANRQYEYNYNGEVDNGVIIKQHNDANAS